MKTLLTLLLILTIQAQEYKDDSCLIVNYLEEELNKCKVERDSLLTIYVDVSNQCAVENYINQVKIKRLQLEIRKLKLKLKRK